MKLVQDGVQFQAFVNTIMNLLVALNREFLDQLNNYQVLKKTLNHGDRNSWTHRAPSGAPCFLWHSGGTSSVV